MAILNTPLYGDAERATWIPPLLGGPETRGVSWTFGAHVGPQDGKGDTATSDFVGSPVGRSLRSQGFL